jgi:uncharacterized integral membrane protein
MPSTILNQLVLCRHWHQCHTTLALFNIVTLSSLALPAVSSLLVPCNLEHTWVQMLSQMLLLLYVGLAAVWSSSSLPFALYLWEHGWSQPSSLVCLSFWVFGSSES